MTQNEVLETVSEAGERARDTVVSGARKSLEVVREPRVAVRRVQKASQRLSDDVAKQANQAVKQANQAAETAAALPERVLVTGLRAVKGQATRKDAVGTAARTLLLAVNTPAGTAAGFFARLEKETALPKRARRRTSATATAAKPVRAAAKPVRAAAKPVRKATRRATAAPRTVRRSA